MATLDASVFVSLFNARDRQHETTVAWLREALAEGEPLRAPVIALAEVSAAIAAGTGDKHLAREVEQQLRASPLFEFLPVALPLADRAAALAAEHQLRGSDALYFAVAETLGDRLVTLNPRQLQRAGQVVETMRPRPVQQ
ncbi:type II toxin-antitoxin system VapC family toxin [Tepidiforma bonchosmolovskayae]|jgi:predicted nucleic acid-binding protein|uniref:Ribonuclease VapC n=1 Tax=Tepidiforma bonchosmolovskayae TaxID=2601677 RepID=A0ABX6C404_9CHLR|nr:PIN domain-containing protein [Tepidiforma bonchosmolovskayae]QFG04006.1 PIN domain-containing protein [Tepidiforma bonchosmolovskayae]